jgi:peptide deformylase
MEAILMIREIIKDEKVLGEKCSDINKKIESELAASIIIDLIDTAEAHKENCVGLAANQIGYNKSIIIIKNGDKWFPMINPKIIEKSNTTFISKESCMSFEGEREIKRHTWVVVMFQDSKFKFKRLKLSKLMAVIAQHEIGHTYGELI